MRNSVFRHRLLGLTAAATLCGCSVTPDYVREAPPVPAAWPEELAAAIPATPKLAPLTEDSWRSFFTEAPLQALIANALEHNRDQQLAAARLLEARALLAGTDADRWPQIDVIGQRNAAHNPSNTNTASGTLRTQGQTTQRYDANLTTVYELDFWGRLASLNDAARANYLASDFARRNLRLALIADIASAYFALNELYGREYLLKQTLASRQISRDLMRQRRDVGLATDMDYFASESAWQAARAEAAGGSRLRAAAENALRVLTGKEPQWSDLRSGIPSADGDASTLLVLNGLPRFPTVAIDLPAEALLRRPDVQAAEQKLLAANANIGAARAAFLPRISLTAAAGTASAGLSGLFATGSGAWTFIPSLKLPLFDGGKHDADLDIAKARRVQAVAEYERSLQQAFREVADVLTTIKYGAQQVDAVYQSGDRQLARVKLVEARFQAGIANALELHDARREAFAAQLAQLGACRQTAIAAAAAFRALGGV
jgi:multidrug efflux system outer membrane protein